MSGPLRLAAALLLLFVFSATLADFDLWGHVRFGGDIVRTGSVTDTDPYSFTSDRKWVNHEWLSEVAMFTVYSAAGAPGLVSLKLALVALTFLVVAFALTRQAIHPRIRAVLLVITVLSLYGRALAVRPQLFSFALFAILLMLLIEADRGRRRALVIVPVLMALWPNLHGGWIVGLGVLVVWAAFDAFKHRRRPSVGASTAAVVAAAALATLLNPDGIGMWRFLWETVGLSRPDIEDWQPLTSLPIEGAIPWILTTIVAGAVLVRGRFIQHHASLAIVAMLAIASFRVVRVDIFYTLAAVILLGPRILPAPPTDAQRATRERGVTVAQLAVIVAVLLASIVLWPGIRENFRCIDIRASRFPEPEVVAFVREQTLRGKMLTWFDWGEYAIWHFAPSIVVSMDGRRETVYSDDVIQSHRQFYENATNSHGYERRIGADYVWLPRASRALGRLRDAGWKPIFEGPQSIMLAASELRQVVRARSESASVRCFPGP